MEKKFSKLHGKQKRGCFSLLPFSTEPAAESLLLVTTAIFVLFKTTVALIGLNASSLECDSSGQQLLHPLHTSLESSVRYF